MKNNKSRNIFVYDADVKKPSINMAINRYYFDSVKNDEHDFVFRIYSHMPGIILGCNEAIEDVNLEKCIEKEVEVVRRPTGGSFVYVDGPTTLCYSVFLSKKFADKKNIHDIYKSIVFPLQQKLGNKFEVQGNYYLRLKKGKDSLPVAGHSLYSSDGVFQFDGIVNINSLYVEKLSELTNLRKLYSNGDSKFVEMNGEFYDLRGRKANPSGKMLLVADEKEILTKLPGIVEGGQDRYSFIHLLKESVKEMVSDMVPEELVSFEKYKKFLEGNLKKESGPKMKAQGHCFVDFLEPEVKYKK